jgi:acetyl-CoA synthetase
MRWEPISKPPPAAGRFNLADYERARAEFSWAQAKQSLDGLPEGGLNIAYEAVDRHALGPEAGRVALRCLGRRGEVT